MLNAKFGWNAFSLFIASSSGSWKFTITTIKITANNDSVFDVLHLHVYQTIFDIKNSSRTYPKISKGQVIHVGCSPNLTSWDLVQHSSNYWNKPNANACIAVSTVPSSVTNIPISTKLDPKNIHWIWKKK